MGCRVVAVTSSNDKLGALPKKFVDEVIVAPDGNFHKQLTKPVDMVFECVGEPTLNSSLRSLRRGGRLILAGTQREQDEEKTEEKEADEKLGGEEEEKNDHNDKER